MGLIGSDFTFFYTLPLKFEHFDALAVMLAERTLPES
jgi:hypothetical protein